MFRILIADSLPGTVLQGYQSETDIVIDDRAGISQEELRQILPDYDGMVVRSRTKVTAEVLSSSGRLKVIGRAGAGVDNIDTAEATRRGIVVMNTPGGNTIAATEHTIALMLAVMRNIPQAYLSMKEQKWDRKAFMGRELFGKTIGVIGLGKIGRAVAQRLTGFGVRLLGYDPLLTQEMANRLGIELVDFESLLTEADVITIHVPRMPQTMNLLNAKNLKKCKPGVIILNCARGGIINEQDLLAALNEGQVGAAAIDVYEKEPPANWELVMHPRVIATPHLGASTEEAQIKVADQILQQMIEYFRKNVALNAVNFVSVDEKLQPLIAPYFQLALRLGIFLSQVRSARVQGVAIRFYGDITELPLEPIASHLLVGAFKANPLLPETHNVELINMVNALTVAREKGIEIEIAKKDHPLTSHTNLIACDFSTEEGTVHAAGTVYAKDIYRLVEFGSYITDAELADKMVLVENDDVPGVIGKVGTILGEKRINIGHLSSGRFKEARTAMNIFNVEGDLTADLGQELESIDHVHRVWLVDMDSEMV